MRHGDTDLRRGLEPMELIVLGTLDGVLHAGQVSGVDVELEDTVYTVAIGARLPEDLARERIDGLDGTRHDLLLHEVVDLLGDL